MSTIIVGDVAAGQMWWGEVAFLKQQLALQYAKTNPYMETWKFLTADVKVFIKLVAGHPHAIIYSGAGFIYMECGIIDYTTAILSQEYYRPGTFHPSFYLSSNMMNGMISDIEGGLSQKPEVYWGITIPPPLYKSDYGIFSTGIPDGTRGCAVGNTYQSRADTALLFPTIPNGYNSTGYITKKTIMDAFPGSIFTGMAKLFVQSMYGSDRNDLELSIDAELNLVGFEVPLVAKLVTETSATLPLRPYTMGYNVVFLENNGVYTIAIMIANMFSFQVRSLETSNPLAVRILAKYATFTDPEERQKIQSYLLSVCLVGDVIQDWTDINGMSYLGNPLNYSWKFSNDGTKGVMVVQRSAGVSSFNTIFTKIVLNISYEFVDGELRMTTDASVNSVGSISSFLTNIHVSQPYGQDVEWLAGNVPGGYTPDDGQISTGTAIVYAYFEDNTIVDVTVAQATTFPTTTVTPEDYTETIWGLAEGEIYVNGVRTVPGALTGGTTITIGSQIITGSWTNTGYWIGEKVYATGQAGTLPTTAQAVGIGSDLPSGRTWDYDFSGVYLVDTSTATKYSAAYGTFLATHSDIVDDGSSSYAAQAICIPDKDASAVVIYDYAHNTVGAYVSSDNNFDTQQVSSITYTYHDGPDPLPTFTSDRPITYGAGDIGEWFFIDHTDVDDPQTTSHTLTVYIAGGDCSVDLLETNTTIEITDDVLRALFFPWEDDVESIPSVSTVQSIQGSYIAIYQASSALHTRHFDYRAAVGWA